MNRSRRAFTLLEVTIAMSILAVSLVILMESQGNAVFMTQDAEKVRLATMLAEEKMTEAQLRIEYEGWKNSDIEENGDFDDFGQEDFRGTNLRLDFSDSLDKYKWAYTIRQIDISIPTDLGGMAGDMMEGGYFGEEKNAHGELFSKRFIAGVDGAPGVMKDLIPWLLQKMCSVEEDTDDDEWTPAKSACVCINLIATTTEVY